MKSGHFQNLTSDAAGGFGDATARVHRRLNKGADDGHRKPAAMLPDQADFAASDGEGAASVVSGSQSAGDVGEVLEAASSAGEAEEELATDWR
jgi:hypothetical protein